MADEQTTNKSFERPAAGRFARQRTGKDYRSNINDLDTILGRFEREEFTVSNTNKQKISGGEQVLAKAIVIVEDDNEVGEFAFEGDGNNVQEVSDPNSNFGTTSGSGNNHDVYNDGNNEYVVENQSGSEVTYEVILIRAV